MDVQFVCAMARFKRKPTPISGRFLRHFVPLFVDVLGKEVRVYIVT